MTQQPEATQPFLSKLSLLVNTDSTEFTQPLQKPSVLPPLPVMIVNLIIIMTIPLFQFIQKILIPQVTILIHKFPFLIHKMPDVFNKLQDFFKLLIVIFWQLLMNMNSPLDIIGLLSISAKLNISVMINSKTLLGDTDFLIQLKFIHAHTFLIILITQESSEDVNSPQITQSSHVSISTILPVPVVPATLDIT